jgi:transposase-like protein
MAKHLNPLQKEFLIHQYKGNPTIGLKDFCLANNVTEPSMKKWIKQYDEGGLAGLARADAETANVFPEGVTKSEEALKREVLRLRIENERLKKNYIARKNEDGKMEYCLLRQKTTK